MQDDLGGLLDGPPSVGPYVFLQKIGTGAYASVFSARHSVTMTTVAVKAVAKNRIKTAVDFKLLQREVALMKTLDHPFIASLFDVLEDPAHFYLVIEHIENGTLLDYINATRGLQEQQAHRLFCQLVSVLEYLHFERRIVHRDLKAENVLMDRHMNVRLIDFGLSTSFGKEDAAFQTTCGSPAYVAPEIIKEQGYTATADIWSLGILLFAMVAGTLPFSGENIGAMLSRIIGANPVIPNFLSMECQNMIERLLTKDPKMRITIPQIKEHPWVLKFEDCKLLQDDAFVKSLKTVNLDDLDKGVISEMKTLNIDTAGLLQDLTTGVIGTRTAAYKMLRRTQTTEELREWQTAKGRASTLAGSTSATAIAGASKTDKLPTLQGRRRTRSGNMALPGQQLPALQPKDSKGPVEEPPAPPPPAAASPLIPRKAPFVPAKLVGKRPT
jgi:serine/threonine protein kinase